MEDSDFFGSQFGQPKDTNIKESITEITELYNLKEGETYIILNDINQFKIAKLRKVEILPELIEGKKKFPKVAQFNFNSDTDFILQKHFNGSFDDWKDMGGELFSKYRVFHLVNSENVVDDLSKIIKNKVKEEDFKILNEPRPNLKFKEKYLKYKSKYISLKKNII